MAARFIIGLLALSPSSLRNGFAVVAAGANLAVHLHRWASLEG